MNDLSIFEKIAPFLKDPLVLTGFVVLVMATVFVTIIQSGAIPVLTKKAGGEVLKRVILLTFIGLFIVVVSGISLTFYKLSKTSTTFDFTVFLENSNGESVVKGNGKLFLRIGNDKREETIDQKGSANFKQIPAAMKGKPANLQMDMAGWQFENGKRTTEVPLIDNSAVVLVEHDNTLRFITGSVKDADGNYLPDVSGVAAMLQLLPIQLADFPSISQWKGRKQHKRLLLQNPGLNRGRGLRIRHRRRRSVLFYSVK